MRLRLHYLLNASREWSLWSSLYLLIYEPMLTVLILLKIIWSSLLKWIHTLQVSIVFPVRAVSLAIHLGFGPLDILVLANVVGRHRWFLSRLLPRRLLLLWLVIYRILVLDVVVRGSDYFAMFIFFSAFIGQNVFIHKEINSPRKLVNWNILMPTRLIVKIFCIQAGKDILGLDSSPPSLIKQLLEQLNLIDLRVVLNLLKKLFKHLHVIILLRLAWIFVWYILRNALEHLCMSASFDKTSLLFFLSLLLQWLVDDGFFSILVETF